MARALITDLYELHMAASYLRRAMVAPATFSLYVRQLPPERGFLVASGLDDCMEYLETLAFVDADLEWLATAGFAPDAIEALSGLRFTGDVWAVPEGRVVLAGEPLLEVTAPLPEAQLVETYLLNQITFQTALASKAVRCRLAAPALTLVDFALRRTHGVDAGMAMARAGAMAGFAGTSNVEAARLLGIRASGTMAHSFVEAFDDEAAAFDAYCDDVSGPYTFLVDTYDTRAGVTVAAEVIKRRGLSGEVAVRLDSGDLAAEAAQARRILDAAGLPGVRIFVSGALDEYGLEALVASGAPVDGAGVGTRVGVSADAPYLDSVYKLVELDGRPRVKRSPGKETLPGAKQVWRRQDGFDLLGLRHEEAPAGTDPLLVPVMAGGHRLPRAGDLAAASDCLRRDLDWLPGAARRIRAPEPPPVYLSDALDELATAYGVRHTGATGSWPPRPSG